MVPWKLRIFRSTMSIYMHDMRNFLKYSSAYERFDTQLKMHGFLTKAYHVVEKGLTMPETRLGFGKDNVVKLIELCKMYDLKQYDKTSLEFTHSINALNEYLKFHSDNGFEVDPVLVREIQSFSDSMGINTYSQQIKTTREEFSSKSEAPFDEFCKSRRSVRNFSSEDISLELLHQCVQLAQTTPSPCNRQPNRVYIVKNREIIEKIFSLQNGNRGFGHLGNAVLVFTSDLSVFQDTYERNEMYLNSGKFIMSMIYALHRYKIGSCALNWSVPIHKDLALKKILNVPSNEKITMTLVCGYLPDEFKVAFSPKIDWKHIAIDIL